MANILTKLVFSWRRCLPRKVLNSCFVRLAQLEALNAHLLLAINEYSQKSWVLILNSSWNLELLNTYLLLAINKYSQKVGS